VEEMEEGVKRSVFNGKKGNLGGEEVRWGVK